MKGSEKALLTTGAIWGGAAVALGAYGAHGIPQPPEVLDFWETGVQYQMWHALAGLAAGLLATLNTNSKGSRVCAVIAGWLFLIGSAAFSGTLYFFVLEGYIAVTGVAPAGGFMMIGGWIMLALAVLMIPRSP